MADKPAATASKKDPLVSGPDKSKEVQKPKESKETRFRRLANRRVPKALKQILHIGNLSTKGQYEYTKEQVDKMFGLLHEALRTARARFDGAKTTVQESIF